MGHKEVRLDIQTTSMDNELRNTLWSALLVKILKYDTYAPDSVDKLMAITKIVFMDCLKQPIDQIPGYHKVIQVLRKWFFDAQWFEVYDFIESCLEAVERLDFHSKGEADRLANYINSFLERELSGFRLVKCKFTPIVDKIAISAINEASDRKGQFSASAQHIQSAIRLISDRKEPDYRNSIKESISAVESVVRVVSGSDRATLGDALKIIDKRHSLHGALKEGLLKIYGYTSDQGGIRHSLLEDSSVDQKEAMFMLVICSAFCSFLIEKYSS